MNGFVKALILDYNNYFNRIIKKKNTKEEYLQFGYEYQDPINFEPNDGVDTTQIFNIQTGQSLGNYIVIVDDQDKILSRWFVIEQVRTRDGQYKYDLRRDLIVDYYLQFQDSTCFIERGFINEAEASSLSSTNPMIFNHEPLQFNKIKKDEWLLYNKAHCPWIMIYLARTNGEGQGMSYSGTFKFTKPGYSNGQYVYSFGYGSVPSIYTEDAEFEIIGIPFVDGEIKYLDDFDQKTVTQDKFIVLQWVSNMISKFSGTKALYDAQLVPYCPFDPETLNFAYGNVTPIELGLNVSGQGTPAAVGFHIPKSKFTQIITNNNITHLDKLKDSNELELFRITSPNGVGNYDYSPAKNWFKDTTQFEVDVTLKPISPYIKINPKYNADSLYGDDFNDYRGLICSGNFSLSILTNEWLAYELNNKNYQTMFNREIETLDKTNDMSLIRDIASVGGGALGGTVSGAVSGGLLGGVHGAVAGAAIGGVTSSIGGAADVIMNEKERELNKQLKERMFYMSHDNVKSRAVGLTRSTLFNINNKIFPYVEHYVCTEKEKQYFTNYINKYSYNIGIISTPLNYLLPGKFIQGSIIKIDLNEDYHLTKALSDYFEIGFRLEGE